MLIIVKNTGHFVMSDLHEFHKIAKAGEALFAKSEISVPFGTAVTETGSRWESPLVDALWDEYWGAEYAAIIEWIEKEVVEISAKHCWGWASNSGKWVTFGFGTPLGMMTPANFRTQWTWEIFDNFGCGLNGQTIKIEEEV
ncbi:MAG TPA: hypothetical protein V6D27_01205 [Vampirovibrionales bacterium]